jgi:hypothetical protein
MFLIYGFCMVLTVSRDYFLKQLQLWRVNLICMQLQSLHNSSLTFQSLVVSMCMFRFNTWSFCFCSQGIFVSFISFSVYIEITPLNSINQLVFVIVMGCAFVWVWTEYLNNIQPSFGFKGLQMSDVMSNFITLGYFILRRLQVKNVYFS